METGTSFLTRDRFREMAKNGRIRCLKGMSPFGEAALVLLDERIIFLGFGDFRQEVLRRFAIKEEFTDDDTLVLDVFSHPKRHLSSAMLFGTPFQLRVWKALLEIPMGTTVTYSDIAMRIRAPKSLRAVGSAVGENPLAYLVPCHRVVSKNGSIGGYHYGTSIKEKMLLMEKM